MNDVVGTTQHIGGRLTLAFQFRFDGSRVGCIVVPEDAVGLLRMKSVR